MLKMYILTSGISVRAKPGLGDVHKYLELERTQNIEKSKGKYVISADHWKGGIVCACDCFSLSIADIYIHLSDAFGSKYSSDQLLTCYLSPPKDSGKGYEEWHTPWHLLWERRNSTSYSRRFNEARQEHIRPLEHGNKI